MSRATLITFELLLRRLRPDVVCDIGSRDGREAARFAKAAPRAHVLAFEANDANAQAMARSADCRNGIYELVPIAISDTTGTVSFFVVDGVDTVARGQSSLLPRAADRLPGERRVEVRSRRLDELVTERWPKGQSLMLWIDVEGAAQQVLSGAEGVLDRVDALHVELENRQFWQNQALGSEVIAWLTERGFRRVGPDSGRDQQDVLFLGPRATAGQRAQALLVLRAAQVAERVWERLPATARRRIRRR